jgi:hypothetical protein
MRYQCHLTFFLDTDITKKAGVKAGDKGISVMKSKQQSPCSNCMHRLAMPWDNACSACMHKPVRCMHWPVTSQAEACTYRMGCKVSSSSQIYLYSIYFGWSVCPWNIFSYWSNIFNEDLLVWSSLWCPTLQGVYCVFTIQCHYHG